MEGEAAILRGVECPVPERTGFASIIGGMVRGNPLSSVVEIDLKNRARTLSVARIWSTSEAIIEHIEAAHPASRPVLVLCFDSFVDLIAAGWAAAVMDRDCFYWHVIEGHESSRDFSGQWRGLQELLGDCQLITRSRLLREFHGDAICGARQAVCIDRIPQARRAHDQLFERDRDHGRIFVRTSGTTGTGKLAVIPYAVQLARMYSSRLVQRDLVSLGAVPMDNITGISGQILTSRLRVLINPAAAAFDPLVFLKAVERFGVEEFVVSTSFAVRLIRALQNRDTPLNLSTVRHLSIGFEPIATRVVVQLIEELERHGAVGVRVSYGYGLTEVGRAAFSRDLGRADLLAHLEAGEGAFPLATCAPGRAIRIVDGSGKALAQDQEGEIQIHAPQRTIEGYLQTGGHLVSIQQEDGWVFSGDIGKINSRGLVITGRSKGIIFSNGKCVSLDPVEQALRDSGILRDGLVVAAPLEDTGETSDYIVMVCPADGSDAADVTATVRRLATAAIGIRPARSVVLAKARFLFTTTGKLKKREMARLHGRGEVAEPSPGTPAPDTPDMAGDPLFAKLCGIWSSVLNLRGADPMGGTFFELGGDSIAAVEFLYRAEQALRVRLPAERFFAEPTLQQVWRIFCHHSDADVDDLAETGYCLERLGASMRSWKGQRLSENGFLRGFHTQGTRLPLFWVFQSENELLRLAAAMGEDQPIYGMRSLHKILLIRNMTDPVLTEVSNQYLTELLAITQGRPFVVGGNCQGAIVALRMAQALDALGAAPSTLVLMEWTSTWGRYSKPVLLLYGNRSRTAAVYDAPHACGLPWRHDFPNAIAQSIEGAHGEFFQGENIPSLRARLLEVTQSRNIVSRA